MGSSPGRAARRLLIVEDDDDVRRQLEDFLALSGYETISARDGGEALEWLSRQPADLVITDLLMPRLGGHELIKRIRETKEWAEVPIILLSGYGDLAPYSQLPANAIHIKPISLPTLLREVQRLIGPPSS
jgi:CheY-like chemotaxis protein